ncbi:Uncharacterized protein OBRU01_26409, partial [Operophtera brumata]
GRTLLCVGSYAFCSQNVRGLRTRWICSTHKNMRCKAAVITYDDTVIKINNIHNHEVCHLSRQKRAKPSSVSEDTTFIRRPFLQTGSDGLAPAIAARDARRGYSHIVTRSLKCLTCTTIKHIGSML